MAIENTLANTNSRVSDKTSKVFNHGNNKTGKLNGMMDSASGIQKNIAGTIVGGGRIIAHAAGALGASGLAKSLTGSNKIRYKKTNESVYFSKLSEFYNKFSSPGASQSDFVDMIDGFVTFDCYIEFFPSIETVLTKNVSVLVKSSKQENQDTLYSYSNPNGGPININYVGKTETNQLIPKLLKMIKFKNISSEDEDFFENEEELLVEGEDGSQAEFQNSSTLLDDGENSIKKENYSIQRLGNNYLNLGIFIQKILIPNIAVQGTEDTTTPIGKFPIPGNILGADNNTFNMDIVNVRNPILEEIFYPWMRETTLPIWTYEAQPYTTATIKIIFNHSNVEYVFYGCRPTQIQMIQPDQSPTQSLTRNVTFAFDMMAINNTHKENETVYDIPGPMKKMKLGSGPSDGNSKSGIANSALFSAANTFRM